MTTQRSRQFLLGLGAGALTALAVLASLPLLAQLPPGLGATIREQAGPWVAANLGYSLLPFALTLLLFRLSLHTLERRLNRGSPVHKVAQADQLTDIWIGLFFGIGVIWTAIGMRGALLYALGDGVGSVTEAGAAGLLERLVRGGILTALTTTIVGGAGGYLLRLYKTLRVGSRLKRYYSDREQLRAARVESLLREIQIAYILATPSQNTSTFG